MSRDLSDRQIFCLFLQQLSAGEATIGGWNEYVLRKYGDHQVEACRRRLADLGLSIGQCSAIPFPLALQQVAAELHDQLSTNL